MATFLEVAYDVASNDQSWLRAVVEAALAVWGRGDASHACLYDASNVNAIEIKHADFVGLSQPAIECVVRGIGRFTPAFVTRTFRTVLAGAREVAFLEMKPMAIGQSTKETAYALGIADATVRVLLGRAATKLGVRSRAALLLHPEVSGLCPGGDRG